MKLNSPLFRSLVAGLALTLSGKAQNNLILQLDNGAPFRVLLNDRVYNDSAQSQVQLYDLTKDTVFVKVETGPSQRYGVTVYLLDKGKKTSGKEFTYILRREKNRLTPVFLGVNQVTTLRPRDEVHK